MAGSGLFTKTMAAHPHLLQGSGGTLGEVADLRKDVAKALLPLGTLTVDEWTNPAASGAATLAAAAATVITASTVSSFLAPGVAALAAFPRNVTFTTAGGTAADAPATATITGTDVNGKAQTETVALAQTGTIALGVKAFKTVTKIDFAAGDGTGATIAIGIGGVFGLKYPPKARAGLAAIVKEISGGAVVTNGVLDATNSTYAPNAAPNGSTSYAAYYEYVSTV